MADRASYMLGLTVCNTEKTCEATRNREKKVYRCYTQWSRIGSMTKAGAICHLKLINYSSVYIIETMTPGKKSHNNYKERYFFETRMNECHKTNVSSS